MKPLFLLITSVFTSVAQSCIDSPCSLATNFSADILGEPDTRQDTWGTAGSIIKRITFKTQTGYRVRILRVYGDFLIWPLGQVERGKFAGALFGLQTTAPEGSVNADWAADNTMLYLQVATGGKPARAEYNYKTDAGGLLQNDNVLVVKMAVWLNDTGLPIHMEPSLVIVYRFEKFPKSAKLEPGWRWTPELTPGFTTSIAQ